ncbi:MAG: hypothetical protein RIS29_1811 [Bacteroidota bacterium]|jgi:peptidyl-prolyl cis-trans isomerase B (cyclophilin B)
MTRIQTILATGCIAFALVSTSCHPLIEKGVYKTDLKKDVELRTSYGTIVFRLSDETPRHRNNFIKLVNTHVYDSLLFHRVINHFLIQTGDPTSKTAPAGTELGDGDLPYPVAAEINTHLFHKRGAINAARNGDEENPLRNSSSTQFTIIKGRVYTDSTLKVAENRLNYMMAYNNVVRRSANKALVEQLNLINNGKMPADSLVGIKANLKKQTEKELLTLPRYRIPDEQRKIYMTEGGAAHLDQNYTVFGEVISGMDVVDKIAATKTDKRDRPVDDVRIHSVKMIRRR